MPGQRKDDPHAGGKLILGAIYVLFGMAILAMCFDLMQEEIVAKFRWIGRKIGIIEKDDEIEDEATSQTDKNNKLRTFTNSSANGDSQVPLPTQRTLVDDDNQDWSKQNPRKMSPRNNIARIHPLTMETHHDANLYQRNVPQKNS